MPIDDILTENEPDAIKFDINVAEQIALITSNRMIQICFGIPKS